MNQNVKRSLIDIVALAFFTSFTISYYFYNEYRIEALKTFRTIKLFEAERTQLLLQYDIQNLELNKIIEDCRKCNRTKNKLILSGDFPCELF